MKSNKINISFNEKDEEKDNNTNNININNNVNDNNFSNIIIKKEYESCPVTELKERTEKNISKSKISEVIEVEYEEIQYLLYIDLKWDNTIYIKLVSKDGHIPYSYHTILNEKKFHELNSIFVEIKTIDKIYNKIINLLKKDRVYLVKDKDKDIFYLILEVTIIDEDIQIYIPLYINDNIQISTINYLIKETELLKNNLFENEIKKQIEKENIDLNLFKQKNLEYINIINNINKKYNIKKDMENYEENILQEKAKDEISDLIIAQNEESKELKNRINIIENEFNLLLNKIKCEFFQKNIIFYHDINNKNPYYLFHFGIKNIGNLALSSKYDQIYLNIEGIKQDMISFYTSSENYVHIANENQILLPKDKINICKKMKINNLRTNSKYEFMINLYSLCHGKITDEPLKIIILTCEYKEKDFISLLKNKELNFDISNQKIIFEYLEEINFFEEDDDNEEFVINKKRFKVSTYLYNNKKGIVENKYENWDDIDNYVIINKDYINFMINKIYEQYKYIKEIDKEKIGDIICKYAGNYQVICNAIEKLKK